MNCCIVLSICPHEHSAVIPAMCCVRPARESKADGMLAVLVMNPANTVIFICVFSFP